MPHLHYGSALSVDLDPDASRQVAEAIGARATRGGWVTVTDRQGNSRLILITPGIPIWIDEPVDAAGTSIDSQ